VDKPALSITKTTVYWDKAGVVMMLVRWCAGHL